MPGQFSKDNRPRRPGAYFNFEGVPQPTVLPSSGRIVAMVIHHDWGPFQIATLCTSWPDFLAKFGATDTAGARAVKMAFQGEGVGNRGGAGGVLVLRTGTGAATKATIALGNVTPAATAMTFTARYQGTFGNSLRITNQNNAADSAKADLIIELATGAGFVEVERYTYPDADISETAAFINANSSWVTAVANIDNVALAVATRTALATGADGAVPGATEYTNAMTALEVQRFGIFVPYDLDDNAAGNDDIQAALRAWVQGLNANGKRCFLVLGGETGDTITTANTRAGLSNDPNIINVGVGTVRDDGLIDATTGQARTLNTAQLAPRIAGVLANAGESRSLTYARLIGLEILTGATEAEILRAFDSGTVVLSRGSNVEAPVRIEKGLTTYTTATNPLKPYTIFRNPKYVATMHGIETELTEFSEDNVVGKLPINSKTRQYVVGEMQARIKAREEANVLQSNSVVGIDNDPPPSDDDDFVAVAYAIKFTRSTEQVFNTVKVG